MAETDSINTYFFLNKRINESRERLRETDRMFFAQTMSSYVTEDGMQIISKGFDIQRNCNRHLDIMAEIEQNIEISEFKWRQFNRYLDTLSKEQRLFLKEKYMLHRDHLENEPIERDCADEIKEIEQAARYRFKLDEIEKADRIERAKQQAESMQAFMNSVNKSVISSGGRL
jgi:hypothetical protein